MILFYYICYLAKSRCLLLNNELRNEFHQAYIHADRDAIRSVIKLCEPIKIIRFFSGFSVNKTEHTFPQVNSIDNAQLWISSPNTFNDPFDCAFNLDIKSLMYNTAYKSCSHLYDNTTLNQELHHQHAIHLVNNTDLELQERVEKQIKQISEIVFVSCFSEYENLLSLRMWGHYASKHCGFCAEYDFNTITRQYRSFCPIRYSDVYSINHDPTTPEEYRAFRLQIGFTKAEEWDYEKEWRVIVDNEDNAGIDGYSVPFPRPKSIYMGVKIKTKLKEDLIKLCKEKDIHIYQMYMQPESFRLEPREVTM